MLLSHGKRRKKLRYSFTMEAEEYSGKPYSPSKEKSNKNKTTKDSDPIKMNLVNVPIKVLLAHNSIQPRWRVREVEGGIYDFNGTCGTYVWYPFSSVLSYMKNIVVIRAFLVAQTIKDLPAVLETWN